jgi:hypothetical protein
MRVIVSTGLAYIFEDNIEDRLAQLNGFPFYLSRGAEASLLQVTEDFSERPLVVNLGEKQYNTTLPKRRGCRPQGRVLTFSWRIQQRLSSAAVSEGFPL